MPDFMQCTSLLGRTFEYIGHKVALVGGETPTSRANCSSGRTPPTFWRKLLQSRRTRVGVAVGYCEVDVYGLSGLGAEVAPTPRLGLGGRLHRDRIRSTAGYILRPPRV